MKLRTQLMDSSAVNRALIRISHEIIEKNKGLDGICLLGIRRRGVPLAQKIADYLFRCEGITVPTGVLDITLYRDDLTLASNDPVVNATDIPFNITGKKIILVDDVLYTGRTARAAIEAVFSLGRPDAIQLLVLIDRGHRELPIRADYVGKSIPTAQNELVAVCVNEYDGCEEVNLYEIE